MTRNTDLDATCCTDGLTADTASATDAACCAGATACC